MGETDRGSPNDPPTHYREVGVLGSALIGEIEAWAARQASEPASFWVSRTEKRVNLDLRKAQVRFLHPGEPLADRIVARLMPVAVRALSFLGTPDTPVVPGLLQHSVYPTDGGHHTWHPDRGRQKDLPLRVKRRRLSMSVLLRAADDGGVLELADVGAVEASVDEAVAFLPERIHRVSPVRAGNRVALTTWFLAPEDACCAGDESVVENDRQMKPTGTGSPDPDGRTTGSRSERSGNDER